MRRSPVCLYGVFGEAYLGENITLNYRFPVCPETQSGSVLWAIIAWLLKGVIAGMVLVSGILFSRVASLRLSYPRNWLRARYP